MCQITTFMTKKQYHLWRKLHFPAFSEPAQAKFTPKFCGRNLEMRELPNLWKYPITFFFIENLFISLAWFLEVLIHGNAILQFKKKKFEAFRKSSQELKCCLLNNFLFTPVQMRAFSNSTQKSGWKKIQSSSCRKLLNYKRASENGLETAAKKWKLDRFLAENIKI